MDYKQAGVDIEAGDDLVRRIKPLVRSTFNTNVLADIGLFGALYDAKFPEFEHPVLVSSTDGVGTKLKVAFAMGVHSTVGQDLVNHCVNDILACGAKPLFFLDYFATGRLEPSVGEQVISGLVAACRKNGCALIGGETAEMPSMYADGEYDMAGTIVGVVEKSKVLDGKSIQEGDVLIGLRSSGLHTNGYSLGRKALLSKFDVNDHVDSLGTSVGSALLEIHRSYLGVITPLLEKNLVLGLSHITGGGIVGNTSRVVPKGLALDIQWDSWKWLPIFTLIQEAGGVNTEEMRHVFNLGIGMIIICRPENAAQILAMTSDEQPVVIGSIIKE
ncbi:MAG: phosphoribosylformylglycinamidine cyclo-ligase [Candidatus Kapabacteria bacterium]|nr:phosphoribosylformylglycinamidine cyclo-ligase [Candidatus Kapabacteria bacterium]